MSNFQPLQAGGSGAEWIEGNACFKCSLKFSLMKRPSHCRHCGNIFCKTHCNQTIQLPYQNSSQKDKVCEDCYFRFKHLEESNQNRLLDLLKPSYLSIISGGTHTNINYLTDSPSNQIKLDQKLTKLITTASPTHNTSSISPPKPPLPPIPSIPSTNQSTTNKNDDDEDDPYDLSNKTMTNGAGTNTNDMKIINLDLDSILQSHQPQSPTMAPNNPAVKTRTPYTRGSISLAPGHVLSTANYFQFIASSLSDDTRGSIDNNDNKIKSKARNSRLGNFDNLMRAGSIGTDLDDLPIEKFSLDKHTNNRPPVPKAPLPEIPLQKSNHSDDLTQSNAKKEMKVTYGTVLQLEGAILPKLLSEHKLYCENEEIEMKKRDEKNKKISNNSSLSSINTNDGLFSPDNNTTGLLLDDNDINKVKSTVPMLTQHSSLTEHQYISIMQSILLSERSVVNKYHNHPSLIDPHVQNSNLIHPFYQTQLVSDQLLNVNLHHPSNLNIHPFRIGPETTISYLLRVLLSPFSLNPTSHEFRSTFFLFHKSFITSQTLCSVLLSYYLQPPSFFPNDRLFFQSRLTALYLVTTWLQLHYEDLPSITPFVSFVASQLPNTSPSSPTSTSIAAPHVNMYNNSTIRLKQSPLASSSPTSASAPLTSVFSIPGSPDKTNKSIQNNNFDGSSSSSSQHNNNNNNNNKQQPSGAFHDDYLFKNIVDISPPTTALQLKLIEQQIFTARSNLVSLFAQAKMVYYSSHIQQYANTIAISTQHLQHHILSRQIFLQQQPSTSSSSTSTSSSPLLTQSQLTSLATNTVPNNNTKSNLSSFAHLSTAFDSALLPTSLLPMIVPPLFADLIQSPTINPLPSTPLSLRNSPLTIASILTLRNVALFSTIRLRDCVQHAWIKHPKTIQEIIDQKIKKVWNLDPYTTSPILETPSNPPIKDSPTGTNGQNCPGSPNNGANSIFTPGSPVNRSSSTSAKHTTVVFGNKNNNNSSNNSNSACMGTAGTSIDRKGSLLMTPTQRSFGLDFDLFDFHDDYAQFTPQNNGLVLLAEEFNRISQWVTSSVLQSGLKQQLHSEFSRFLQFRNQCRFFEVISTPEIQIDLKNSSNFTNNNSVNVPPLPSLPELTPNRLGMTQSHGNPTSPTSNLPPRPTFPNSSSVTPGSLPTKPSFGPPGSVTPGSLPTKPSFGPSGSVTPGSLPNKPTFGPPGSITPKNEPNQSHFNNNNTSNNSGSYKPIIPSTPIKNNPFLKNDAKNLSHQNNDKFSPAHNNSVSAPLTPTALNKGTNGRNIDRKIYLNSGIETVSLTITASSLIPSTTQSSNTNKNNDLVNGDVVLHEYPSNSMLTTAQIVQNTENMTNTTSSTVSNGSNITNTIISTKTTTTQTVITTSTDINNNNNNNNSNNNNNNTSVTTPYTSTNPGLLLPDNIDEGITEMELLAFAKSKGFVLNQFERRQLLRHVTRFTTGTINQSSIKPSVMMDEHINSISGPIIISGPIPVGTTPVSASKLTKTTPIAPVAPVVPQFSAQGTPIAPVVPLDPKIGHNKNEQNLNKNEQNLNKNEQNLNKNENQNLNKNEQNLTKNAQMPPLPLTIPNNTSNDDGSCDSVTELIHVETLEWDEGSEPMTRRRTSAMSVVMMGGVSGANSNLLNTPSTFRSVNSNTNGLMSIPASPINGNSNGSGTGGSNNQNSFNNQNQNFNQNNQNFNQNNQNNNINNSHSTPKVPPPLSPHQQQTLPPPLPTILSPNNKNNNNQQSSFFNSSSSSVQPPPLPPQTPKTPKNKPFFSHPNSTQPSNLDIDHNHSQNQPHSTPLYSPIQNQAYNPLYSPSAPPPVPPNNQNTTNINSTNTAGNTVNGNSTNTHIMMTRAHTEAHFDQSCYFSIIPPQGSKQRSILSSTTIGNTQEQDQENGIESVIPYDKQQVYLLISTFLEMASFLLKKCDFFTLGAIITGLSHSTIQNSPIFRHLMSTDKDAKDIWSICRSAVSNHSNYALYRALWAKATNEYLLLLSNQPTIDYYNKNNDDEHEKDQNNSNIGSISAPLSTPSKPIPPQPPSNKRASIITQNKDTGGANVGKKKTNLAQNTYESLLQNVVKTFQFNKSTYNWETNSSFKPKLFIPNDHNSQRGMFLAQYLTLSSLLLSQNPILAARKVIDIGINNTATGLGIDHGLDARFVKKLPQIGKFLNKNIQNLNTKSLSARGLDPLIDTSNNTIKTLSRIHTHDPNTGKPYLLTPVHERIGQPNFSASRFSNFCEHQPIISFYLNLRKFKLIHQAVQLQQQNDGIVENNDRFNSITQSSPPEPTVSSLSRQTNPPPRPTQTQLSIPLPLLPCVMKDLFVLQDNVNIFVDPETLSASFGHPTSSDHSNSAPDQSNTVPKADSKPNKTPIDLIQPLIAAHLQFEKKRAQNARAVTSIKPTDNGITTINTMSSTSGVGMVIKQDGLPYNLHSDPDNGTENTDTITDLTLPDSFVSRSRSQAVMNQHVKAHSTQRRSVLYDTSSFFSKSPSPTAANSSHMTNLTKQSGNYLPSSSSAQYLTAIDLEHSPRDVSSPLQDSIFHRDMTGTSTPVLPPTPPVMLGQLKGTAHSISSNKNHNTSSGSLFALSNSISTPQLSFNNAHELASPPQTSPIPINTLTNELSRLISFQKIQQQWLALQPICIAIHASYIHDVGVPVANDIANLGLYISQSEGFSNRSTEDTTVTPSVYTFPINNFLSDYQDTTNHSVIGTNNINNNNFNQGYHQNNNNNNNLDTNSSSNHQMTLSAQNIGSMGPGDTSQYLYIVHNPSIHRHRRLPPPLPLQSLPSPNTTSKTTPPVPHNAPPPNPRGILNEMGEKMYATTVPASFGTVFAHIYGEPIPQSTLEQSPYVLEPHNVLYNRLLQENQFFLELQVPHPQIINSFKTIPLPPFPIPTPQPFMASNFVQYVLHELSTPIGGNMPRAIAPHQDLSLLLPAPPSTTKTKSIPAPSFNKHPGMPPILTQDEIDKLPKQDKKQYLSFLSTLTALVLFPSHIHLPWDLGLTQMNASSKVMVENANNPYLMQLMSPTQSSGITSLPPQTLSSERLSSFYSYTSSLSSQPQPLIPSIVIHNCIIPLNIYKMILFLRLTLRRLSVTSNISADDVEMVNIIGPNPLLFANNGNNATKIQCGGKCSNKNNTNNNTNLQNFDKNGQKNIQNLQNLQNLQNFQNFENKCCVEYEPRNDISTSMNRTSHPIEQVLPQSQAVSGFYDLFNGSSPNNSHTHTGQNSGQKNQTQNFSQNQNFSPSKNFSQNNNHVSFSKSTSGSTPAKNSGNNNNNNNNNIYLPFYDVTIGHDGSKLFEVDLTPETSEALKTTLSRPMRGFVHPDFDILLQFGAAIHSQLDQIDGVYVVKGNNDNNNNNNNNQNLQNSQNSQNSQNNNKNDNNKTTSLHHHIGCDITNNTLLSLLPTPLPKTPQDNNIATDNSNNNNNNPTCPTTSTKSTQHHQQQFTARPVSLLLHELLLILPPHAYPLLFQQFPSHLINKLQHLLLWQSLRGITRDDEWCWWLNDYIYPRGEEQDEQLLLSSKLFKNNQQQRLAMLTSALLAHIKLNNDNISNDYVLDNVPDEWLLHVINTEQVIKLEPFQ